MIAIWDTYNGLGLLYMATLTGQVVFISYILDQANNIGNRIEQVNNLSSYYDWLITGCGPHIALIDRYVSDVKLVLLFWLETP